MPFFIMADCVDVKDKSCLEECPVDCIYEGGRKLYINPHECIDCGACEPVCPVTAIASDLALSGTRSQWRADNSVFFDERLPALPAPLGSPGGAAKVGPMVADTPRVAALPAGA